MRKGIQDQIQRGIRAKIKGHGMRMKMEDGCLGQLNLKCCKNRTMAAQESLSYPGTLVRQRCKEAMYYISTLTNVVDYWKKKKASDLRLDRLGLGFIRGRLSCVAMIQVLRSHLPAAPLPTPPLLSNASTLNARIPTTHLHTFTH